MNSESIRCRSCGHDVDAETSRQKYGGACPDCLGAFALEGLLTPRVPTPAPSGGEFGKFVLTDRLGKGGMGEVWKAFDKELKRWVALKFLRSESPQELARFQREATTAAALSHPGIAAIYEVGETGGRHYIAMQYVEGRTLQMHPRKDRKGLARLVRDAARALEHAHRSGVIHRDLKPENLIVEKTGEESRIVILDFGLAKRIQGGESLSKSGTVAGTLQYMSPEQARGEKLDERADVYSLGATLYEVLTGKPPVEGANAVEIMRRIEDTEPTSPRRLNQHIPHDLETIVLKCLEKDRERRYGGAKELADDLDRFLEGDAVMARRASTWYRVKMRLSKRKAVVATAGIAAVILSAFLGWWVLVGSPETRHAHLRADALKLWAEARGEAMAGVNPRAIKTKSEIARRAFERANAVKADAQSLVLTGRCLQLEGKEHAALQLLERAHTLDPELLEGSTELVKALMLKYHAHRGVTPIVTVNLGNEPVPDTRFGVLPIENAAERRLREQAEGLMRTSLAQDTSSALIRGLHALGSGEYRKAIDGLSRYLEEEQWDVQTLSLLGLCHYFSGEFKSSVNTLDRSVNRVRTYTALRWRGEAHIALGNWDEAVSDLSGAVELDSLDTNALLSLANAKHAKKDLTGALADQTEVIRRSPDYGLAYNNRANVLGELGRHEEAMVDLNKAVQIAPTLASARYNRGHTLHVYLGRSAEALIDYTKAIELDSHYDSAYAGRGLARLALKLYSEALPDLTRAIELKPNFAYYRNNRAVAYLRLGNFDATIEDSSAAIKIDPNYVQAYGSRARALMEKGEIAKALEDTSKAISLAPTSAKAYDEHGVIKMKGGRGQEAIADFTKAIDLDSSYTESYVNRAAAHFFSGLLAEALVDITKAMELDSGNANAFYARGLVYQKLRRPREAVLDVTKAIELEKDAPLGYYLLRAQARLDCEEYQQAVADCTQAIELDRKCPTAFIVQGSAKWRQQLYEAALHICEEAHRLAPKLADACVTIAICHTGLGRKFSALDWLEEAVDLGFRETTLEKDPFFDSLRSEERFKRLIARIKSK